MNKISTAVEEIVLGNPLYYEIITTKIANFSSLARLIRDEVEELTQKPVKNSTLVVSLTRLGEKLAKKKSYLEINRQNLVDYKIKLPIIEFVLEKNEQNLRTILELHKHPDEFFSITQGQGEINIVCSPFYTSEIESKLKVQHKLNNLVLISIRFREKLVKTPGLFYYLSGLMFMHKINIVDGISTYTEFNLLIEPHSIQKATQILEAVFKSNGKS